MDGKKFTLSTLFAAILLLVVIVPMSTQQGGGTYDPWLDFNEDGQIDVNDLSPLGQSYGSSGDPTREVYIKYSTYWWTDIVYVDPNTWLDFDNTTQGYNQMSLCINTNSTVTIDVYNHYHWTPDGLGLFEHRIDSFTVLILYWSHYSNVSSCPYIHIYIRNYSLTNVAKVRLGIYMSA